MHAHTNFGEAIRYVMLTSRNGYDKIKNIGDILGNFDQNMRSTGKFQIILFQTVWVDCNEK
jgi:hypothetical protein